MAETKLNIMERPESDSAGPRLAKEATLPGPKLTRTKPMVPATSWEMAKLRKAALRQMDKFISLLPAVFMGTEKDAINKIRVTARRLEQILSLFYSKPWPGHIQKFRRKLKQGRRSLGELRNLDALLLMVEESLAHKPPSENEVWESVKSYIKEVREKNAPELLKDFGRINFGRAYVRFRRDLSPPAESKQSNSHKGASLQINRDDLHQRIVSMLQRNWQTFEASVERAQHHPDEETIHCMRTAAKRLRYLMEIVKKLHVEGSREALEWLRTIQDVVGRWHDLELLEHRMADMIDQPYFRARHPQLSLHTQQLIEKNREVKASSEEKFFWMTRHSRQYLQTRLWMDQIIKKGIKPVPELASA